MREFKEFKFQHTYGYAEYVRNIIVDEQESLTDIESFLDGLGEEFFDLISKPQKFTLLHHFIESVFLDEMHYGLKKAGDELYPTVYELLHAYEVHFCRYEEFKYIEDPRNHKHLQYRDYIIDLLERYVVYDLVEEVFTVIYQDKKLLMKFNEFISSYIRDLEYLPDCITKRNGVLNRFSRWPQWLRRGIYCRDKGRCGICLVDLSGELASGSLLAIDHIVPLNLGGVNDPTNLQQLCRNCNLEKGGHTIETSNNIPLYW
ncbi:HNH endonuclease [Vibrio jasicida]|uniref:HNH endonuclease n=1 Tax=Vibrio jasicida TaxID=766224 RepID=UPI004068840F